MKTVKCGVMLPMKNNKLAMKTFDVITLAGMIYCFAVYLYIQAALAPALPEPGEV